MRKQIIAAAVAVVGTLIATGAEADYRFRHKLMGAGSVTVSIDPCTQAGLTIGTKCSSGIIYGGDHYGRYKIYALAEPLPGLYQWSTANTTTGATDQFDGFKNTQMLMARSDATYPAAAACWNLTAHGYDDWYLPSDTELTFRVEYAFVPAPAGGGYVFGSQPHWTSTEVAIDKAGVRSTGTRPKTEANGKVWCVRREF